jgi:PAS domain S-box-containing protein
MRNFYQFTARRLDAASLINAKIFFAAKTMEHQLPKPGWLSQVESVINAMSEGVAVLEAGRVLFVNEAMLRMTGFQRRDMLGRNSSDFFAPEDLPFIQEQIALRKRHGHIRFEYYVLSKDGTKAPAIISSHIFYGPDQKEYAIVTVADIREQKSAAEKLHKANAKLAKQHHTLLASEQRLANQSYALTELTAWEPGKTAAFKERLHAILETSARTLQVERLSVWRFESSRSAIRCLDLYELGPSRHSSGQLLRQNDFPLYFEALVRERVIMANDARVDPRTREFLDAYLKPASIGVALANAQLRESEARKDAIMQSALDCIITIDHEGKIIEFNPAAEKTFGYKRARVLSKELAATIVPPSLREAHRRGLAHYLATGQGPVLGKRIEITGMRADGSEFPVELAIVPIHLGEHPIFTAYLRDITEPKRAEKELREAKDAAVTANRAKGELLAELKKRHDELEETLQKLKITQSKLEAENVRKTRELEEARRLQLAMLPKVIPKLPYLEMAVFMQTATEVGGDYYDFNVNADGALTVAIGDATGHGLQAGTIVASTKSLFKALVDEPDPAQVLKKMSSALKSMGFRKMFMAMTVAKFEHHRLTLSAAGMPFTLVNRAATGNTEKVILKAVPLGSFPDFVYQQKILKLRPGDTVLFVSDGLHETFNKQEEMLGESRVMRLFTEIACRQPHKIVRHLARAAKSWANGRTQHDDMTILAMKMR